MSTNNPNPSAPENGEVDPLNQPAAESAQPAAPAAETVSTSSSSANDDAAFSSDPTADDDGGDFSMEDFAAILAAHEQNNRSEISENEVVKGRVIKITDQAVIIDVGFKSEGIVPLAEFKEGDTVTVAPGDEVDVFVKQLENSEGYVELSRVDAERKHTWE